MRLKGLAFSAAAAATSSAHTEQGRELAAAAHTDDHATCHDSHYPCAALSHSCEELRPPRLHVPLLRGGVPRL